MGFGLKPLPRMTRPHSVGGPWRGLATTTTATNDTGQDVTTHTAWTSAGMVDHLVDGIGQTSLQNTYGSQYNGLFVTMAQDATGLSISSTYDFNTGQVSSSTDANSVQTLYGYNDPLGRITSVKHAVGTPAETWSLISYPSPKYGPGEE